MSFYKSIIRTALYKYDPEQVHEFVCHFLIKISSFPFVIPILRFFYEQKNPKLERNLFGLTFKNPVGLAAGFDKNAQLIDQMDALGFGFVEIGTLTPRPQVGNDKPRLFRLEPDDALINRMGFNNEGVEEAVKRLKARQSKIIVGGNIGKNKMTDNEDATYDYMAAYNQLFNYVDYFVVNVSSPNTPGLRSLQEKEPLMFLLQDLQKLNKKKVNPKPILLKIAPDLTNEQLDDIIEIVKKTKIAGVVATNTTIDRSNLKTTQSTIDAIGNGGLSGQPLKQRATEVIRYLSEKSNKAFPIIGVGGIATAEDAIEKLNAGASLVQVYTGFIYEGPAIAKKICKGILANSK
jgi:dihydroorotate dehydrogenase